MVLALEMICSQCVCPLKGRKLMALAHALLNQIAFSPLLCYSHASLTAYARVVDLHGSALVLHLPSLGKSLIDSSFGAP